MNFLLNQNIALLGLIEILSALTCGIAILFITYRLLKVYGKRKLHIEKSNQAYQIFIASVLFSVGYMVSGVIQPILSSYRILSDSEISQWSIFGSFILRGGLYIAIAYILSIFISLTGISIYTHMTPIDELDEIKNNNIGVAVVLAAILVVLALMTRDGIVLFIESMVPYPELPPR